MRIITPQSATLTNIEVLSFLSSNPPRRPPTAPPGVNQKHWIPSPDLRDHNTVVKEIHNYAARLAPHLLRYPGCDAGEGGSPDAEAEGNQKGRGVQGGGGEGKVDNALRGLITRLQPYGLTKGEVLMIVNLGVGVPALDAQAGENGVEGESAEQMDVDVDEQAHAENGEEIKEEGVDGEAEVGAEGEEEEAGDYGALALIDTVIEEREQRLSDENVLEILAIIRETLGAAVV
ncbi:uncharacterized protein BDV14DRAFT_49689 [Aspergillus stella-maris]|uniref:uncharacterized protein n=1 Tax=Aspergillus stella-maris TaxID=1810926 RepID=UPI003CCDDEC0